MPEQGNNQGGGNQSQGAGNQGASNQPTAPPVDPKTNVTIPREQKDGGKNVVTKEDGMNIKTK